MLAFDDAWREHRQRKALRCLAGQSCKLSSKLLNGGI